MLKKNQQQIKFTNTLGVPDDYAPKPASAYIPEWYKTLESYINGKKEPTGNGTSAATAKKCMPIFDAITGGYIILSAADVHVSQKDGQPYYQWANYNLIQFHPMEQAPEHPGRKGVPAYPKWINPWAIKTPKGYSTLFIQPMHRESVFTILPGIVDTDEYFAPVNFPFVLNDPTFEGTIPAGTPIAQVIPIKRDNWKMSIGSEKDIIEQQQITNKLGTKFFDRYKLMFWNRKEYK